MAPKWHLCPYATGNHAPATSTDPQFFSVALEAPSTLGLRPVVVVVTRLLSYRKPEL